MRLSLQPRLATIVATTAFKRPPTKLNLEHRVVAFVTALLITRMPLSDGNPLSNGHPAPALPGCTQGMGEPLHNYDSLLAAIDILAEGLSLSRNKIIVSTVGLAPQMSSFLATGKAKLALSLHATTDEVRDWIVPTNRRYPIEQLMSLLRTHFPVYDGATRSPARGDKFVIIEYVMLRGVNDTEADAHRLAELLKEVYCMVNLIVSAWLTSSQGQCSGRQLCAAHATPATFRCTLQSLNEAHCFVWLR